MSITTVGAAAAANAAAREGLDLPVQAVLLSGVREGEIVELPAEVAMNAPTANGDEAELERELLKRLSHLADTLDRLCEQVKQRADLYEAAIAAWKASA